MHRTVLFSFLLVLGFSMLCGQAIADQAVAAKALVEGAAAMAKEKGLEKTLKAINDLKGPFVKGKLYIFAMSLDNKRLAAGSPFNKHLLGTVATNSFNIEMAKIAKGKGQGWVEYSWPKPNEKEPSPKKSYIMRVAGEDAYFGCGYYLK